jgi:hypothetical protein
LIVTFTAVLLACFTTLPRPPLRVTVFLQDQAGLSRPTLRHAKAIAAGIFAASGIELEWTEVTADLRIVILNHRLKGTPRYALGIATLLPGGEDSYAAVSMPAVEEFVEREDVRREIVLGASLAHEVGHVLIGTTEHASSGVMTPRFTRAQLRMAASGRLHFLDRDARQMRNAVMEKIERKESSQ